MLKPNHPANTRAGTSADTKVEPTSPAPTSNRCLRMSARGWTWYNGLGGMEVSGGLEGILGFAIYAANKKL